jgi:cadmium resistance protein CadD (predicted permease)
MLDGMNDPNCAFYVGQMFGQFILVKFSLALFCFYIFYRFVDEIFISAIINKIKGIKFYKFLKGNPPDDYKQWSREEISFLEWVKWKIKRI